MTQIQGSTILLTGASGGIGQAIARALAARGGRLILTGRRAEVLEPLAQELGGRALSVDLADRDAPARLVAEAGDVDVLVANAALPASGTLDDYTQAEIDRALDVNLRAPIALAKLLAAQMAPRGRGQLVFISSLSGKSAQPGGSLYSATKFGLRGFALALRADLRDQGVGVSTVFPGFVRDAGMFAEAGVELPRGVGTRSPEEVAAGVVKAIEGNKAEVDVAPLSLRAGAAISGLAPQLSANVSRLLGNERVTRALADGQRAKR
ncbi:SDR family NAD(P)-dependent oxidoreductase [Conexibacter sp. JD483]|uniref:SDR family NAD(P)-dependent oxidoreductase n=1 Tax=unclassified Conexibacter TaxID=2627773 RepID=UPI0027259277|nr:MULTISPECIES: SDR family NAD(P)-dependent oxidoreductase [unclassified Conexibacter]MDO8185354.1 SDR family NAD(P)-dependent oxidoreductase [Conexibacter sp. CPCC 205706]MDO8198470.1 SDR family NAD(P)-dependent oxidoreductase [Conexibacter sp. CPCC 205762]MDR9368765.1 SDR family NAD(P)-dependent oxidoreductase [Conexibacter sp. JD483]